ncbi:MAG: hypothetical protein IJZ21_03540 [Clostridia bacterium]|nr:hypothetical protein [Clostridia bacterium]
MALQLTEQCNKLLDLLLLLPPKIEDAEKLIQSQNYTSEELTQVAISYMEKCRFEISDARLENEIDLKTNSLGTLEGFHSSYLYTVLQLLLRYRIDINAVYEVDTCHYNLMSSVMWIDNGYVAADSMRLLLENGGDPNLIVGDESVYDEFTFDIFFGAVEQEKRWLYDSWVHTWFVLLGFGGEGVEVELFKEYDKEELFSLHKLRDHRNYDFCLSRGEKGPDIHIFDKETFWKVACL